MEIKVYKREAFLIKKSDLDAKTISKLENRNRFLFFEEKACKQCEFEPDKQASPTGIGEACESCPAFKGAVSLSKDVVIKNKTYLSLPIGDRKSLESIVPHDLVYKSKHVETPFKRKIKFTGKLKDHQEEALDAVLKRKKGVIKAPPRSGKTVMATATICRIGCKTLIIAAQREWLDGFYETFCGSETQEALTNAKKKQVGFCKTYEDFMKYDVCIATYQTFLSDKGRKLLRKLRDVFTSLFIDECHYGAASKFASIIASFNVKYCIGLSATPARKDGRFRIVASLVGPTIYEAKIERLKPNIRLIRTNYARQHKGRVLWTTIVRALETDPQRLRLIAEEAVKDVKQGHMILIPLTQVKPIKALTMAINKLMGKRVAHEFHGSVQKNKRKQLIQDAREYKVRILVGNSKLVSVGINIPRASMLYDVALSSNVENCEQRTARVLTAYEDKPHPTLKIFLDPMDIRKRCLSNEWFNCIKPRFKPNISRKDEIALTSWFKTNKEKSYGAWEL